MVSIFPVLTDLVYMMVVPDPRVHNDPGSSDEAMFSNCVSGGGGGDINEVWVAAQKRVLQLKQGLDFNTRG